jgi:outer membrane protein W
MPSRKFKLLLTCLLVPLAVSSAAAADRGYFSVKGGSFLPNGKGGAASLTSFNSGYSAEVAVGYRAENYAALEIGTGLYSASSEVSNADLSSKKTLYGVPVTATAKAILDLEKLELFAGAGLGYYFAFIDNDLNFTQGSLAPVKESSHGSALGYHLVLGGDYKVSERFRLGADFKYFVAKPELELTDAQNVKVRSKWDVGGTLVNVGLKYLF